MDIQKIYAYALQREHEGKRFFEQNADRLSHAAAVGAFKRLALEEQKHIEFIQRQIDLLDKGTREYGDGVGTEPGWFLHHPGRFGIARSDRP